MNTFQKINIEISRDDVGGIRATAAAEFAGLAPPLRCDVQLGTDNLASVRFSDSEPYTTHQVLNVVDSVLTAVRKLDLL
jgi:hypothetical protein